MNMLNQDALTDEEINELDQFLLDAEGIEESMDIATLDGFMTAIVCGPKTILPSEWMRWVWDMERRRPPLEMTPASQALGKHAQSIYAEIGMKLITGDVAEGGGTDAAFAALKTRAPVLERFGLRGFGTHANEAEYVEIDSIQPRLYLLTRMIMDVSQGKAR